MVLRKRQKTYKNPEENPDVSVDFMNLEEKIRKQNDFDFCQMFGISKNKATTLGKKYIGIKALGMKI